MDNNSPWLIFDETRTYHNAEMRLFCFHYAGAGASIFQNWIKLLPDEVELVAIQLPGREKRFYEPLISDVRQITTTLAKELSPFLDKPFAFVGHSIGALIGFELARVLRQRGMRQPELLIASGRNAPNVKLKVNNVHLLPDDEFAQTVRDYNGLPEAIAQNEELLELLLPRLRSDIAIAETYTYNDAEPLESRIVVFYGTEDPLVNDFGLQSWKEQTQGGFKLYSFPGDHFFLHSSEELVLDKISTELKQLRVS